MHVNSRVAFLIAALLFPAAQRSQAQAPAAAPVPDLSGDWFHPVVLSLSQADPRGNMRGREPDIHYQPGVSASMLAETPATGGDGRFELTTDPYIQYCEPLGLVRTFGYPGKSRFVQTPEAVYILDEIGPTYRIVWLDVRHPEDPDPQYWGHSVGHYENGDTLVVDTVGVNDRTWLDQVGHPHSERLHLVERFTRVDRNVLRYEIAVDDPGAYTAPFRLARNFTKSDTGFMRYQWACSVRDTREHYEKVGKAGNSGETSFK